MDLKNRAGVPALKKDYTILSNKSPTCFAIARGGYGIPFFNHHSTKPTYAFATN